MMWKVFPVPDIHAKKKKKKHSEEESEEWFENHKDNCQINHKGSSGNMKSEKYAPIRNMFILYAKQFDLQDFCSGISVVSERWRKHVIINTVRAIPL